MLLLVGQALALDCAGGVLQTFPADGAQDVPRGVLVRAMAYWEQPELHLEGPEGAVDADAYWDDNPEDADMGWVEPTHLLDADTTYELVQGERVLASFTTGADEDAVAPQVPQVLDNRRDAGRNGWGTWEHLVLDVEPQAATFIARVGSDASMEDAREAAVMSRESDDGAFLSVGSGLCGGPIDPQGDRWVSLAAVGLDGQTSEFSEPVRVGGCSTTPTRAVGIAALLGLLLVRRP